ncbi:MAG: hypothetical protein IKX51_00695 [Bacteroidales bacterium]|nr:hypothetical protein [Bacteroidales bacterium]
MGIIDKIKDGLLGNTRNMGNGDGGVITAQELVDQVFEHFKMRLKDSSTDMSLLFPTSFVIYLNPEDFAARSQEFPARANDIKKKCLKEVRDQIKSHVDWQDYRPHSKYWKIQFVEFKPEYVISNGSDKRFEVEKGHVTIVSYLYAQDFGSASSGDASGGRVVTTVHSAKGTTTPQNLAINADAFKDVTIIGQNSFRLEFLKADIAGGVSNEQKNQPSQPTGERLAGKVSRHMNGTKSALFQIFESSFLVDGNKTDKFIFNGDVLQITGRNATNSTNGVETLRIDDDGIMNPHLNIRYDHENQRYLISAVGEASLNGCIMERNPDNWKELPDNSYILLNSEMQINFSIK